MNPFLYWGLCSPKCRYRQNEADDKAFRKFLLSVGSLLAILSVVTLVSILLEW